MLVGAEHIETMLSARCVLRTLPMAPLTRPTTRHPVAPSDAAPALHRRRQPLSRRRGSDCVDRRGPLGRDRGVHPDARPRLQRRFPPLRARRASDHLTNRTRSAGRRPLHAHETPRGDERRRFECHRGRSGEAGMPIESAPWPSRGRSDQKRPGPATSGTDYFPPAAEPPLHREAK